MSGTRFAERVRPVLFHCAEGGQGYLRHRLDGLCSRRELNLSTLPNPLTFISDRVRIDSPRGFERLIENVRSLKPRLVVLDPLVRLHRQDENSATQVAALLDPLERLRNDLGVAIVIVHHTSKSGGRGSDFGGNNLRGSSDLYAWGDSNLMLRRAGRRFTLRAQHRAAADSEGWSLEAVDAEQPYLRVVSELSARGDHTNDVAEEVLPAATPEMILGLVAANGPTTVEAVRKLVTGSNQAVGSIFQHLAAENKIARRGRTWVVREASDGHEAIADR